MALTGKLHGNIVPADDEAARDAALVARARSGDDAAWSTLVSQYQEPVFRLAYLILGDERETAAVAEDITQETFIRAFRKLHHFQDGRPLRPWLLSIAANLARNRRRSVGRYWAAVRRWWQAGGEERLIANPTQDRRDDARLLWQAIRRLSADHQDALYLRYFLDMSEAEMAEVLEVSPGTVKSRLYRARQVLQTVVESEFPLLYEEWQAG